MNNPKALTTKPITKPDRKISFIRKAFNLAIPFSKRRLLAVFALIFAQGIFQVIGVTSIFPFLAIAADPQRLQNSKVGTQILSWLPEMSSSEVLIFAGLFSISMMFLSNGINIASEFVRNRYAHDFGHWLRMRLLNRMLNQPYSYYVENNSAVLLKKVYSDVMGYVTGVLLPLLEATSRFFMSILLIVTLLFIHLKIALSAAVLICGFYIAIFMFLRERRNTISDELKHSWKLCAVELQQLFGGIKPVKIHEVEDNFVSRFEEPSKTISRHASLLPVYTHVPRYIIEPVAFSALIAVIIYLNIRGRDMTAILPNMGVMALAGYKLLPSLQLFYGQLTQVSAGRFVIEEVYDEFEKSENAPAVSAAAEIVKPLEWNDSIQFKNLSFSFPTDKPILNSISLKIPKNTSIAFVGATGSGKSTIVDLLTGLHTPQQGDIFIDDFRLSDYLAEWRATVGYVPQDVFLTDDTLIGNIAIGIPAADVDLDRIRESARIAQIDDFIINEMPQGYDTEVGERGVRLSGGQRQRIGLARALYRQPSILILDEATSALDVETESALMNSIESLEGEMTVIMVAHRLSTVENCDQIYNLKNGQIQQVRFEVLASQ